MRRKDREMDKEFAMYVANKCEYAVISMIDLDNRPYCLPITIACKENSVYFHSAKEGRKVDILKNNPSVCISCVGDTRRLTDKFTTEFESAILTGMAYEVTDNKEKIQALRLICERHTPSNMEEFDDAISGSLFRTGVWRIDINEITGKRKK